MPPASSTTGPEPDSSIARSNARHAHAAPSRSGRAAAPARLGARVAPARPARRASTRRRDHGGDAAPAVGATALGRPLPPGSRHGPLTTSDGIAQRDARRSGARRTRSAKRWSTRCRTRSTTIDRDADVRVVVLSARARPSRPARRASCCCGSPPARCGRRTSCCRRCCSTARSRSSPRWRVMPSAAASRSGSRRTSCCSARRAATASRS